MRKLLIILLIPLLFAMQDVKKPDTCVFVKNGLCACFYGLNDEDPEFWIAMALCKQLIEKLRIHKWDKLIKRINDTGYGYRL